MRPFLKSLLAIGLITLFCCVIPHLLKAGPGGPGGFQTDVDTPIDGGVGILVAAGVAYGAKKIRDERKKKLNKLL